MLERLRQYACQHRLLAAGDRVAAAVSGGADSVALLRALFELRDELGIVLSVCHFHHGIRGEEADADERFVRELAAKHGLEVHVNSGDAPAHAKSSRQSLEAAARELRYNFFRQLIAAGKVDKIATAHTRDDQAETLLFRFLRGSGTRGLAGIYPELKLEGGSVVRPLLEARRAEVESYLQSLKQSWREDSTNKDVKHARNRIRHELLPLLERSFNSGLGRVLADTAEIARAEEDHWQTEVERLLPLVVLPGKPTRGGGRTAGQDDSLALNVAELARLPLALQRRVLRALAARFDAALEFEHVEALRELAADPRGKGKNSQLPGLLASRTFRELRLERRGQTMRRAPARNAGYAYPLRVPGSVEVRELGTVIRAVLAAESPGKQGYNLYQPLDIRSLGDELVVRNWRPGDRFWPAHTKSPQKVKALLQKFRELSLGERQLWPVVASGDTIVWLRGFPAPQGLQAASQGSNGIVIEESPARA